jgi:hypothetical protein
MWHILEPAGSILKESYLQKLFNGWRGRPRDRIAGLPGWLRDLDADNEKKRTRQAFGYEFTPDVELIDLPRHYVMELKRGLKYEPLALAEVLHHAEWIRRYDRGDATEVVPVIVSSFNYWLRFAIASLRQRPDSPETLRYYEVDVLQGNDQEWIWFDEPLRSSWESRDPPQWLRAHPGAERLAWHHIAETRTWVGARDRHAERPIAIDFPYVMVAELDEAGFLVWEGTSAGNNTKATAELESHYFLWNPADGKPSRRSIEGPRWLAHL